MVVKNVNELCLESNAKVTQDPTDEDAQRQHPTREEKLMKYRNQCKNLVEYLSTNMRPQGLSKNECEISKTRQKYISGIPEVRNHLIHLIYLNQAQPFQH